VRIGGTSGLGASAPEYRKPKLGVGSLDKGAGDSVAALHVFGRTVDQIAEETSAIVKPDERDDVRLLAFPFRLYGPAHDCEGFDSTRA
jgi:hypothetical protein